MGGRKGHSLGKIVGDMRKVKHEQTELIEGVKQNNPEKILKATTGILSKSIKSLESLTYSYLFVDSIKDDYKKLSEEGVKARRKEITKKWAEFREEAGKKFDAEVNREIVDSATRVIGGAK